MVCLGKRGATNGSDMPQRTSRRGAAQRGGGARENVDAEESMTDANATSGQLTLDADQKSGGET
jgi:hypothetical protein